jgi:hypothetical protein
MSSKKGTMGFQAISGPDQGSVSCSSFSHPMNYSRSNCVQKLNYKGPQWILYVEEHGSSKRDAIPGSLKRAQVKND